MDWTDLLFLHWPVPAATLRALIPAKLELDLFAGQAWIGIVPFRMARVHPRFFPEVPGLSAFPEINVRTYVRHNGISGVFFFSLDAANPIAVRMARQFFHLPYFDAAMEVSISEAQVRYSSRRTHSGAGAADFTAEYGPTGPAYHAVPGTLEDWLTARYCFYASDAVHPLDPRAGIYRCDIHHEPWALQPARVGMSVNTMTGPIDLVLPDVPPLVHYAARTEVVAWLPRRVG